MTWALPRCRRWCSFSRPTSTSATPTWRRNVVARYQTTMMDGALEVVRASRGLPSEQQFVWTLAGWPMAQILKGDGAGVGGVGRRERIESALRDGRFVVHGLPFTTHTELLELEDLARGLGYSVR